MMRAILALGVVFLFFSSSIRAQNSASELLQACERLERTMTQLG